MKRCTLESLLALALALDLSGCHEDGGPGDQSDSRGLSASGSPDSGGAPGTGGGTMTASDAATGGNPSGADAMAGNATAGGGAGSDAGAVGALDGGRDGGGGSPSGGSDASTVGSDGGPSGSADATGVGELTPEQLVPGLDGYLYTGECAGGTASFECPMAGCSGNVLREQMKFAVGGVATKTYSVTLHIYGVVELRADYKGGNAAKPLPITPQVGATFGTPAARTPKEPDTTSISCA